MLKHCYFSIPVVVIQMNGLIVYISQKIPDFNEWATGVVSKVNNSVTGSLPDFNEWANGVSQNTIHYFRTIPTSLNLINKSYKLQEILHKSSLTLSILSLIYKTPVPLLLEWLMIYY